VLFYPPDPGSGSGMEQWSDPDPGSGIKHPGSATLRQRCVEIFVIVICVFMFYCSRVRLDRIVTILQMHR
jgi:hypothetical protein